jgi:hypothetical protein
MRSPRTLVASALLAAALLTTACAGTPAAVPTTTGSPTSGIPSSPVATPESTEAGAEATPTCETIIPETTVEDFDSLGWTVKEEPFFIGETQLPGGLQCTWGDYSVASDHVQVFGWAPLSEEQAATARSELLSSGWREVEEAGSVYITENADTAVSVDEEGYGLTYLLGDGWVKLADTKQGLLLVEWPQA